MNGVFPVMAYCRTSGGAMVRGVRPAAYGDGYRIATACPGPNHQYTHFKLPRAGSESTLGMCANESHEVSESFVFWIGHRTMQQ